VTGTEEAALVARLQAGDEAAFATLVRRHHRALVRVASAYVPNRAVAEEVVQDTWVGVIRGIDRFEGRSSLQTWLFHIVLNRARSTGAREHRETPTDPSGGTVSADRFDAGGHWIDPPAPWTEDVENRLTAVSMRDRIQAGLDELPANQRAVVTLRDLEGLSSEEACAALGITEANQRVLLHRGRARLRALLEDEMKEG
jgi:RNA polymerase sigma-70 factor (ECF subfamily)